MNCRREFTIWKVVELSKPVDISSMNSACAGPTSISPIIIIENYSKLELISLCNRYELMVFWHLPVVTRFLCPPDMPLKISSPTMVSAQTSRPRIYKFMIKLYQNSDTILLGLDIDSKFNGS